MNCVEAYYWRLIPDHVKEKITLVPDGCWLWQGEINRNGYGRIYISRNNRPVIHRWLYELLKGPIPVGLVLDHLCVCRNCCNPTHMSPVTFKQNTHRGRAQLFKKGLHQPKNKV